jgi:membrane-associated HD superfamily phosphohydrolase
LASNAWPELALDEKLVHLGAATHDIGKTAYPQELSEPGHLQKNQGEGFFSNMVGQTNLPDSV